MKYLLWVTSALFLAPLTISAQTVEGPIAGTIAQISALVNDLIPLLLAVAVLLFLWGLVKFIANIGDETARAAGKSLMVWGMIALFVMVSFWGIIGYVQESLGLTGAPIVTPPPPSVNVLPQ
ncbi:MAG: hypothetical protein Q8P49_03220 [Candidatus Liptonbacteria bacterium]|nr:hypothetical protein [Candidatus Liptonbacteria bacterium]